MNLKDLFIFLCGFLSVIYLSYNYQKTISNYKNTISNYKLELYERFQYEDKLESDLDICNRILKENVTN